LKKGKVKKGFIYENAQKKVLANCNFCPGKSHWWRKPEYPEKITDL
jgi:hypothetical protein